jgi:hypothetical protein
MNHSPVYDERFGFSGLDSFVFDYFLVDSFVFDSPSHTCHRIHLSPERVKRVVSTCLTCYFVTGCVGLK